MIKKYLITLAIKRIIERYEAEIDECIDSISISCIKRVIDKYNKLIEGLMDGKN